MPLVMEKRVKIFIGAVIVIVCWQSALVKCQNTSQPAPECNNATCPCCSLSVPCPSDGSGQCLGNCKNGYHGGKCLYKCPSNCISCIDAQGLIQTANCTQCNDGYFTTASLYQCQSDCSKNCKSCEYSSTRCTSCNDGYYLTASYNCSACKNTCASCSSYSKCTSCMVRYYLNQIDGTCHKCNALCYGCDSADTCYCSNGCSTAGGPALNNVCLNVSNLCLIGCKDNFINNKPFLCDVCTSGNYGVECDRKCNVNCKQGNCERLNGTCNACSTGFYGDKCDVECPVNCKSCNRISGKCDSCINGFFGMYCNRTCAVHCMACLQTNGLCASCNPGYYGSSCNKCPENCLNGLCNMNTGHCSCVTGFTGTNCSTPITTTLLFHNVVTVGPTEVTGPVAGITASAVIVIVIVVVLAVVLFRRRSMSRFKGNFNIINLDEYHLAQTDLLEENDEFDPTYFIGKALNKKTPCGKLPLKDLAHFVETHEGDFYQEEFLKLPRGIIKPCEDARIEANVIKNRFTGIYPYDEHRVKLLPPGSDFINASYIDGFKTQKEYIASLGPTRKAMEGFQLFWRMVWQEKTDIIVMVTNLMEGQSMKCEQYWPDVGTSSRHGKINVTLHSEDFYSEFIVRKMSLSMGCENRTLNHLHYTAWPDKLVPDDVTSLIQFRHKVNATASFLGGPIIVHCSAGIGRTGTYIAMDILIHQGKAQKSLDIFEWVTRMREQRTSMVQTWQQYEFLHRALVHALTFHSEPIEESKFLHFLDSLTDKRLKTLFKHLTKPEKPGEGEEEARTINKGYDGLNREGADIPGSLNRPLLHLEKRFGESNYINAVYVNSYTVKDRFLVCQTPLPDTVKDFLTLIIQESCSCIVSMDPPGLKDPTTGEYFSRTNNETFILPSGIYEVETHELDKNPSYILRKLIIQHNQRSGSTAKAVYHYQIYHWPHGNQVPDVSPFLQLVQDVDAMADRESGHRPVLVHCLNAAERSGLYCAVSNLIQKMRVEGEVSVVNTLRQIKVRRPLAISNKEQIMFCYKAVQHFLNLRKTKESLSENAFYCNV